MSKAILLALALLPPLSACSAAGAAGDLNQEYTQVRKIALKDPKVREAFQKANERLNDKILQIDPALKPVVEGTHAQARPPQAAAPAAKTTHVVTEGETLGSIAKHYKVTAPALEKANHIADARKLRIGQKLAIPAP